MEKKFVDRKKERVEFVSNYLNENYNNDSYEASAEREDIGEACYNAMEWADRSMIEKACKWLEENFTLYQGISGYHFANDFRKAMEE